jgi:DNA-nicking Smr family endonuclease
MKLVNSTPPPRARRRLTHEEEALWKAATRAVKPMRPARASQVLPVAPAAEPAAPLPSEPVPKSAGAGRSPVASAPVKPAVPPLATVDRRLKQRVGRGVAGLDARLDLHGMTQESAYRALLQFLRVAQANEAKLVLVITGKGARGEAPSPAGRGILRRQVPLWLGLGEFRPYVIGFGAAHPSHGGEGALYVRVRRAR